MTKDEALKLALSALNEVRQETSRLMKDSQTLYSEKKVWEAIYTIKKVLAQPEQEPVAHSVVAGALFDFMGWLTSRNKRLTLSGADEASPAVEAIQEFSEKRGLSIKDAEVGFWTEFLSTPPPVAKPHKRKPLTDEEINQIADEFIVNYRIPAGSHYDFARAIESAHGIKGEA